MLSQRNLHELSLFTLDNASGYLPIHVWSRTGVIIDRNAGLGYAFLVVGSEQSSDSLCTSPSFRSDSIVLLSASIEFSRIRNTLLVV